MVTVKKFLSKKGNECVALFVNDVIVTFDFVTIMKVADCTYRELSELKVGEFIKII